MNRFFFMPLVLLAGLLFWPATALLPCEQNIVPGKPLKLDKNWRFRTGSNNPGNREPALSDSNWERVNMPARFADHPTTKKFQGYIWYRCTINLDEKFFVREKLNKEPPAPTEESDPEAADADETSTAADGENETQPTPDAATETDVKPAAAPGTETNTENKNPDAGTPAPEEAKTPATESATAPFAKQPEAAATKPGRGQADPAAANEAGTLEGKLPAQPGTPTEAVDEVPAIGTPAGETEPGEAPPGDASDPDGALDLEEEYGPPKLKGMGDLAIYLGNLGDADTAYFNGEQIGQTGLPDADKPAFDVEKERLYSIPHHLWRPGKNVVSVLVLGTTQASGFARIPEIVPEQPRARQIFRQDAMAIVFSFLYILVGAFFALFAIFFRDQKEHLFFSLFSLLLGVYNLFRTNMRYILFDGFTFETTYQIELILLMLLPICFLNFLIHIIGLKNTRPLQIYYGLYGLLILAACFIRTPIGWTALINLNLLMLLVAMATALYFIYTYYDQAREQLKYVVTGMIPLAVAIVYDMIVTFLGMPWIRLTVYAFLLFLGFVALQLSGSILQLFHRMRDQEEDLIGLEKRKTRSIFNISREFSVIQEGIYNGLDHLENRTDPVGQKGARKAARGKTPNIERSMRNLDNLVNDSRLIQLLESNDYAERNVNFSLRNLSQAVIDRALVATGENKRRLILNLPEEELQISGDPDLLSTALYHLVENALYYSSGRIEVYAEREYTALKFTVRDEGPGMNPEQQRIIFQKFIRGSDDSEVPGIGIGLPIVNLIARQLRGDLRLESGEGFFSTFIFQVPLPPDQRAA